jgi:hypothetical protein
MSSVCLVLISCVTNTCVYWYCAVLSAAVSCCAVLYAVTGTYTLMQYANFVLSAIFVKEIA